MMSRNEVIDKICEISSSVKKQQFETLAKEFGESDMFDFYESDVLDPIKENVAMFYINPYENYVIWDILECLSVIDDIKKIEIEFAENKDEDYDTIRVWW